MLVTLNKGYIIKIESFLGDTYKNKTRDKPTSTCLCHVAKKTTIFSYEIFFWDNF